MSNRVMRSLALRGALVAGLALGACKNLDVADLNFPSLNDLTTNPTPSAVATATGGLISGSRVAAADYVLTYGIFGREGYNLDPSNPQNPPTYFSALDQDRGSGTWVGSYRNIKQANLILAAVDVVQGLSDQEKEGIRGFAITFKAYDLLKVISVMDASGAALDVNDVPTGALPPLKSKAEVYAQVLQLFDQGASHLQNGGAAFAFSLPPGFNGFDTPAQFLKVNRALKARADMYVGNYAAALTDLGQSFIDPAAPMALGVYYNYSTNSGDAANPLYDPQTHQLFAHPSIWAGAQLQPGGAKDARALAKLEPLTISLGVDSLTRTGYVVKEKPIVYNSPSAPIAIIRNEELLLLRAEANIALAGAGDATQALADINTVRTVSGALAPITAGQWTTLGATGQLDELLYNKTYSLYWEEATRWIDARRYGRLAQLPKVGSDVVFAYMAIPRNECTQRTPEPAACDVNTIPKF